jgi:hypothetical protein
MSWLDPRCSAHTPEFLNPYGRREFTAKFKRCADAGVRTFLAAHRGAGPPDRNQAST